MRVLHHYQHLVNHVLLHYHSPLPVEAWSLLWLLATVCKRFVSSDRSSYSECVLLYVQQQLYVVFTQCN